MKDRPGQDREGFRDFLTFCRVEQGGFLGEWSKNVWAEETAANVAEVIGGKEWNLGALETIDPRFREVIGMGLVGLAYNLQLKLLEGRSLDDKSLRELSETVTHEFGGIYSAVKGGADPDGLDDKRAVVEMSALLLLSRYFNSCSERWGFLALDDDLKDRVVRPAAALANNYEIMPLDKSVREGLEAMSRLLVLGQMLKGKDRKVGGKEAVEFYTQPVVDRLGGGSATVALAVGYVLGEIKKSQSGLKETVDGLKTKVDGKIEKVKILENERDVGIELVREMLKKDGVLTTLVFDMYFLPIFKRVIELVKID